MPKPLYGEVAFRRVSLEGRIPWELIPLVRAGDERALKEAQEWTKKYTSIVLFTQGLASGDEEIVLSDTGELYMEVKDTSLGALRKRVAVLPQELQAIVSNFPQDHMWTKRTLSFLKIYEEPI
jgi:hypothetical protein